MPAKIMPAKFDIIMLDPGPKLQLTGCQCDQILSADDPWYYNVGNGLQLATHL